MMENEESALLILYSATGGRSAQAANRGRPDPEIGIPQKW